MITAAARPQDILKSKDLEQPRDFRDEKLKLASEATSPSSSS